jgi:hypothetical protein
MTTRRRHLRANIRTMRLFPIFLGAGLIALLHPTASQALVFTFSFTDTIGNVGGTVTGEIDGLVNGANVPATDVILESYPSGIGLPLPPQNAFSPPDFNSFGVSNNKIVDADYLDTLILSPSELFLISLQTTDGSITNEEPNLVTIGPISYTLLQPTPVPALGPFASLALLALGLFLLRPTTNRRDCQPHPDQPEGA